MFANVWVWHLLLETHVQEIHRGLTQRTQFKRVCSTFLWLSPAMWCGHIFALASISHMSLHFFWWDRTPNEDRLWDLLRRWCRPSRPLKKSIWRMNQPSKNSTMTWLSKRCHWHGRSSLCFYNASSKTVWSWGSWQAWCMHPPHPPRKAVVFCQKHNCCEQYFHNKT